jgi:hypothetical protein
MSEIQKNGRVFADGLWAKQQVFSDGGAILKLTIVADKFSKFLIDNKTESGFVNLIIREKKFPDSKSTHTCYLDDWKPSVPKASPEKQ